MYLQCRYLQLLKYSIITSAKYCSAAHINPHLNSFVLYVPSPNPHITSNIVCRMNKCVSREFFAWLPSPSLNFPNMSFLKNHVYLRFYLLTTFYCVVFFISIISTKKYCLNNSVFNYCHLRQKCV